MERGLERRPVKTDDQTLAEKLKVLATGEEEPQTATTRLTLRFRLLGLLPLLFFIGQAAHYWRAGGLANLLWMCNIGNLLLAVGLFAGNRAAIRVAAIWMIPGLPLWFSYVVAPGWVFFASMLNHVGGFVVALVALRRVRVDRNTWLYAFAWYLIMETFSSLLTAPDLNVNVAHRIQPGWEQAFSSYWKFWLVMSAVVAAGLWVIGMILRAALPAGSR